MRKIFASAVAVMALMASPVAAKFPEREITFIVNYAAGGSTDVSIRALMVEVEKKLGVPVQVINRPGGQGTVGPQAVATAKPDGYTLGSVGAGSVAITPLLLKVPYTLDDFEYLSGFASVRYGIAVGAQSPITSIEQLVAEAKKRRVTFSATGVPNNLGMFKLGRLTGAKFNFVPFPSGAEAVTAAMGAHVDATLQSATEIVPAVESGRLRLLAVANTERWAAMPDVKTLHEIGHDVLIAGIIGIVTPKGVPKDRLRILSDAINGAVRLPSTAATLEKIKMSPAPMTGEEYDKFVRQAQAEAGPALREAGLLKD
jgi:tripartite-type tricarboxylate transporter receptor subunit TctC